MELTDGAAVGRLGEEAPIFVRVAHRILAAIQEGTFPAGERLPSEQTLAEQFGVSRPSLREALSALQFAGYLASKQGFGTVVVSKEQEVSDRHAPPLTVVDPVDVLQARLAIEPQVIAVAALNPDLSQLKEARAILNGMWLAVTSANDLGIRTDVNLHLAMVNVCKNRFLRSIATDLLRQTNPPRWSNARTEVWANRDVLETWATEHEATLAAIESRDANRAIRCCRRHLLSTVQSLTTRQHIGARDRKRLRLLLSQYASSGQLTEPSY
jgi:DNA-binding FadR family transcriptional regulator